jgi:uroporphyrinogen-III decarboxylase
MMTNATMTNRARVTAILEGRHPDRIPWMPRLKIWYEAHRRQGTLPARYQGWTQREIERDLGMDRVVRDARVFRTALRGVETRTHREGETTVTTYVTPVGTVSKRVRQTETMAKAGIQGLEIEHLIKGPADYPAVEFIVEHTAVLPTYDDYRAYEAEIGAETVPLVCLPADPMYTILQDLIGYERAFYHMQDYPDRIAHLLGVLTDHAHAMQQVVLDSPARLFLHGEHFNSMLTPPPLFTTYMQPYFRAFADKLHAAGKTLACHADADVSLLLDPIKDAGFDMVECFVTAPMVPLTLERARAAFGTAVIIWGGLPSTLLCDPVTDEAFEDYMRAMFRTIAPGDAFILGVADNIMPETKLDRLRRVRAMIDAWGQYPVEME